MTTPELTPTQWFDQFGADPAMDGHKQWCGRHWAPCPRLGANGMMAAISLMRIWLSEIADRPDPNDPQRMNAQLETTGRICCALGDERMYELWGECPPPEGYQG